MTCRYRNVPLSSSTILSSIDQLLGSYRGLPTPAERSVSFEIPPHVQQVASCPSITTAGIDPIESEVARAVTAGSCISKISTSHDEQVSSFTVWIASSQIGHPAEKIFMCLFAFTVVVQIMEVFIRQVERSVHLIET